MLSSGVLFVLFKGLLGFGLPLAFAVHQLWDLRREDRRAAARAAEPVRLPVRPAAEVVEPERRAA